MQSRNNMSKQEETILLVDDSAEALELLRRNIAGFDKTFNVHAVTNVSDAIDTLKKIPVDIVITDLRMPEVNGIHLVKYIRDHHRETEVLVVTGFPSIDTAVESIRYGAEEYLTKPYTDKELEAALQKVTGKLRTRRSFSKSKPATGNAFGIIGESQPMRQVFSLVEKVATTNATVLVTGESGTGKELVARAIHYRSARASQPFIAINCAALPGELLESELFGHMKGAFTGANETRAGFFQMADKGTIFLDEIGSTSPSMQAKLLRVLQEKEFYMVGGNKPIKADVRVISAANVDLPALVKKETFREDLYYRLNVFHIHIPPLRERGDDLILLIDHYVNRYVKESGKTEVPVFSDDVITVLRKYNWPGNVRELQNLVYRLVLMAENNRVLTSDLPPEMRFSVAHSPNIRRSLEEMETEYIYAVLASVRNNKSEAAKILGIDRKTLRDKLKNVPSKK